MDPLSDVLSLLRPRSHITAGLDAGGEWAIRFDDVVSRIKCYALMQGACWLAVDGVDAPVRLAAGECFVLASGRPFTLASDLSVAPVPPSEVFGDHGRVGGVATYQGGGGMFLTGSRFSLGGQHTDLLLSALPPVIHLDAADDQALIRWAIERMMLELREHGPGASLMVEHLGHMMLIQALRLYLKRAGERSVGWFSALSDPQVAAAISAMHADPARRWTLDALGAVAGMSRSVFAARFREKVGETPITYLTRWRMVLAGDRLVRTDESIAETARALGYESESAFNTAFKRVMGVSPRRYARSESDAR